MPTFQYFSDVHTEFYTKPNQFEKLNITPMAPNLILAGDIGYPTEKMYKLFLEYLSKKFEKIFLISGNHEYYNTKRTSHSNWMTYVDNEIQTTIKNFKNIIYLQNQSYDLENTNITIFGGTFWSKINEHENVHHLISDYTCIPKFTMNTSDNLYSKSILSLEHELENKPTRDFIIISHHMPSYSLVDQRYKHTGYNSAFATDIKINDICVENINQIKVWVYGHTHISNQCGKFYCNPIGYIEEMYRSNPNKIFTLE